MNNEQEKIFKEALQDANTANIDLSAADWAQSVGLMHNFGHGNEWKVFTKGEAVAKIEEYAERLGDD